MSNQLLEFVDGVLEQTFAGRGETGGKRWGGEALLVEAEGRRCQGFAPLRFGVGGWRTQA